MSLQIQENHITLSIPASGISLNPSKIFTSAGSSNSVTSVSGFLPAASLESTGLMQ